MTPDESLDQVLIPRPGLIVGESAQRFGRLVLRHNPGYSPCDMLHFLELVDLAHRRLGPLLAVDPPDTLVLLNPDNNEHYRELAFVHFAAPREWRQGRLALFVPPRPGSGETEGEARVVDFKTNRVGPSEVASAVSAAGG